MTNNKQQITNNISQGSILACRAWALAGRRLWQKQQIYYFIILFFAEFFNLKCIDKKLSIY